MYQKSMKVDCVLRYENQTSYMLQDARSELLELSRARKTKNIETRRKKKNCMQAPSGRQHITRSRAHHSRPHQSLVLQTYPPTSSSSRPTTSEEPSHRKGKKQITADLERTFDLYKQHDGEKGETIEIE